MSVLDLIKYADILRDSGLLEEADQLVEDIDSIVNDCSVIRNIENWQRERLLDKQQYNALNEATNIIEELLEGFGYNTPKNKRSELRANVSDMLATLVSRLNLEHKEPTYEDRLDSIVDQIVFSIGSIMKLGYDPVCALNEVYREINSRTGVIIDCKFQKDTSKEAKAKWVSADYLKCKKEN